MSIYITGSVAYDRIMNFPGTFSDYMLPDKIHILNVSFMIERLEEKLGGCAGNIAYSLAVLGEKGVIVGSVGRDFARYEEDLLSRGMPLEGVTRYENELTAGAYIIPDLNNNQITAFNPGAMRHASAYDLGAMTADDIPIVSPGNIQDMRGLPPPCQQKSPRGIFDPCQQLPVLTGQDLL